ncbi:sensor histidine kinase [Alteraurantiacibacter aquimixticola]|uniref:sensor histidine kinase n=1 Tax=Alteraurantiacibacter aquimixticola TaxID=2489173 RepID=UPI00145BC68E|nr:HAMP domain-containing sensor histidine kinase [Alteraurantiacibacter aquimixticola]
MTWNSQHVIAVAQDTQDRVHTYNHLLKAVREYHNFSYRSVREDTPEAHQALGEAKRRFELAIEDASRLPVSNLREREVRASIATQSRGVLDHFRDAKSHVAQVDSVWQERGSRAALNEVSRIIAPILRLERVLEQEIRRGDIKLANAMSEARELNQLAIAASLVCLLLGALFLVAVIHLVHARLRPGLARLEEGATAIGAGRLDHRIRLEGGDELAALGSAFDLMADEIDKQQKRLQEIQRGLEAAVADRTSALKEANAKLSTADERRRNFLTDIGHELRTPLTIIRGETQVALRMIEHDDFDPHETFDMILCQTDHLRRMVADLFLIARAEVGELPLDKQEHDLAAMVRQTATDFDTLVRENGGTITAETAPVVTAMVDAERLHRALTALIDNALQHCQPGVDIVLEAKAEGETVELSVSDNGPGIPTEQSAILFGRFSRGVTRGKGSGLGLSLVSALAEAHGGHARIADREGGGTRVTMQLPSGALGRIAA